MPAALIKDFLLTQGLKLPLDEVRAAYLTAQTVMDMGTASIDRSVLWRSDEGWKLADYLSCDNVREDALKRLFMALDSVFSRSTGVQSAAVYALMPSENQAFQLICLSRQGEVLENLWDLDEAAGKVSLACRSAQSGWMNVASDVRRWLDLGSFRENAIMLRRRKFPFRSARKVAVCWAWFMWNLNAQSVRMRQRRRNGWLLPWLCPNL